ncbi:unnamed protein product [Polarella glacialis]|uniref:Uncharacterized protein n=1 Tax=Polarella glacialis TaxID=89957 RepID=A0A813HCV4_POLGL|nr:unnamed protein product [Polarella glacialis]CAE8645099.1 unnamed protein product [Polarella glacialis]|mmetsp:Transcript_73627/g.118798  ORF Transcript_73627/g.118798 Transcript_73627/m.118798 type:complete len:159 (+) Transcript_73627:56-532(+)
MALESFVSGVSAWAFVLLAADISHYVQAGSQTQVLSGLAHLPIILGLLLASLPEDTENASKRRCLSGCFCLKSPIFRALVTLYLGIISIPRCIKFNYKLNFLNPIEKLCEAFHVLWPTVAALLVLSGLVNLLVALARCCGRCRCCFKGKRSIADHKDD